MTAGSQEKIDMAKSLGAADGFNYKEGNFSDKVLAATNGKRIFFALLKIYLVFNLSDIKYIDV